jgi:hypothetical protein
MKERIEVICSKQLSYIIAEYTKLHVNNTTHICLDSTYLAKTLEKNGVNDTTSITIKTNFKAYKHLNQILSILIKDENLIKTLIFTITSMLLMVTYYYNTKLIEYISPKLAKYGEITVSEALSYHRVKDYLFYNNNSPLRGINIEEAERMTNEILNTDKQLNELIIDCRRYFISLKLSITFNALCIILLLTVIFTFSLLLHCLRIEIGIFRTITTSASIIFIMIALIICFKIIIKSENLGHHKELEDQIKK